MGNIISTVPQNLPTASVYQTSAGHTYSACGDQKGMILAGTFGGLWADGSSATYPGTNDFSVALQTCANVCDSNPDCRSFNILTVYETDFNNNIPTWECRFSKNVYVSSDYTLNNGLPSYAWTLDASPVNMPSANPYLSQDNLTYYPIGDQHGNILSGTFDNLWASGAGQAFPASNDYSTAVKQCTKICDSDQNCNSFNVLTAYEGDFNNNWPTWTCRFSPKIYDPNDYTTNNGYASYVWARAPKESYSGSAPQCNLDASYQQPSPQKWRDLGMDAYITSVANSPGVVNRPSGQNFAIALMGQLGRSGYLCSTDQAACSSNSLASCADLVNYQIVAMQWYMKHAETVLDNIVTEIASAGQNLFVNIWAQTTVQSFQYDSGPLFSSILGSLVWLLPEIGTGVGVLWGVVAAFEPISMNHGPANTYITPDSQSSWTGFISALQSQIDDSKTKINAASQALTQSLPAFLRNFAGGPWFVEDATGNTYAPDVATMWPQLKPYFMNRVAMQALASQSVFFLSVPMSIFSGQTNTNTPPCSQAFADQAASAFPNSGSSSKNVAFCYGGQIIVPVLGYDMQLYYAWPNLLSQMGYSDPGAIYAPSAACYPGFGQTTKDITLYNAGPLVPLNPNSPNFKYDMSAKCTWAVPICDQKTFEALAGSQGWATYKGHAVYSNTWQQRLTNIAGYCSYNFKMSSSIIWSGNTDYGSPISINDPHTVTWQPTPVVNVL